MTHWPLREAVAHFRETARDRLLEAHRHSQVTWGLTAPHMKRPARSPKPPPILTEEDDG